MIADDLWVKKGGLLPHPASQAEALNVMKIRVQSGEAKSDRIHESYLQQNASPDNNKLKIDLI
jgi:hypothetical protein